MWWRSIHVLRFPLHIPEQLLLWPFLIQNVCLQGEPGNKGPDGDPVSITMSLF